MFGLLNNMLFPDTHHGGTNTSTHPSFLSCKWQFLFVCLAAEAERSRILTQPTAIQ